MASASEEKAIDAHSQNALMAAKRNLRYLYDPATANSGPTRRRNRALLRVLRSSVIFVFWRLVRYAKYVAIGSLMATVGAGAFGTVVSGAGFVLAPTGIAGTIVAASIWGVGNYAVNIAKTRWGKDGSYGEIDEARAQRIHSTTNLEPGPEAMPW